MERCVLGPERTARGRPQTGWYPQFRSEKFHRLVGKVFSGDKNGRWDSTLEIPFNQSSDKLHWKMNLLSEKNGFLSHELVKTSLLKLVWLVVSYPEKIWSLVHPNQGVLRCYWNYPM